VERFSYYQRRFRYVLKLDVEKYFPSIDHAILRGLLRRKIACPDSLALADLIVDRSNPQHARNILFAGDTPDDVLVRRRGLHKET
jgi:retron-type reverse transcriptase